VHLAIRSSPLVESPAARLLGRAHPLSQALDRRASLRVEIVVLSTVLGGSLTALAGGAEAAMPVALPAMLVAALAVLRLVTVRAVIRSLVLTLLVEGRGALPLVELQQERARLLDAERLRRVAQWLRRVADGSDLGFGIPSLIDPRVAAGARTELLDVAAALSRDERGVAGVALLEQIACEPWSPLFGDDAEALQEALARVRFLLAV
jgi:hypothetical protein